MSQASPTMAQSLGETVRFRLYPTPAQEAILREHCAHARFVWNLALEQAKCYCPEKGPTPNHRERCRQLTEARNEFEWLAGGSVIVQQQALRDFNQAMQNFYRGLSHYPKWRKAGQSEGFRIVGNQGNVCRPHHLNRKWGAVQIPKIGLVKFRWTRDPGKPRSFRVIYRSSQWHVAFAVLPESTVGPRDDSALGIDRGVVTPFACSDGTTYALPAENKTRLVHLQRKLARQKKDSNCRAKTKLRIARLRLAEVNRRKDAIEKATTDLARRCDWFAIEDLRTMNMVRRPKPELDPYHPGMFLPNGAGAKASLNSAILRRGWGYFARRLSDKAPDRVIKVNPAFTSQTCSFCEHIAAESRESQSRFRCVVCGFTLNADINAARNILAAGLAVTGRGGLGAARLPMKRQPFKPMKVGEAKMSSRETLFLPT